MTTAYTLAANATLRDIGNAAIWGVTTARSGGDTVDTNGFNLTIDQDSRYGLSGTTSTTWGNFTINATKGGKILIDGTKVWMIPFTGGSGTLTLGTQITIGGVTCNTIGIYADLVSAPVTTASSGWLKVTNASGVPGTISDGTYAGFTLTANGPAVQGFIEVNGDESATVYANRLGAFQVTGAWYTLGTTSGASNQTLQIPNNGTLRYAAGVFIEQTSGLGDYEFYPNAGTATTVGTEAARGKVVWIDNTGLVRIGNNGSATSGYTPAAGLAVVIGNVFFENNTTSSRTANVIPNATVATRHSFTTTGGGVVSIDKCNMAWYLSCTQAYSVALSNSGFVDAIYFKQIAQPMVFSTIGVGSKPTTELIGNALYITYSNAGGTFTNCVFSRASLNTPPVVTLYYVAGFTFTGCTVRANTIIASGNPASITATRADNCNFVNHTTIEGSFFPTTCDNFNTTNLSYINCVSGTTNSTYGTYVWNLVNASNCVFSGLTFPLANNQPYSALLYCSYGSYNIKLRNIGTYASPIDLGGSSTGCNKVYILYSGCHDIKIQHIYVINSRYGLVDGDNTVKNITEENVWGKYSDAIDVMPFNNMTRKGMGETGALTALVSVYGTHWLDNFTSTTAGRIAILMNEPTVDTAAQVTLSGGCGFTSNGSLSMFSVGQIATFEMPYYAIGHTGFANTALVMAGGTATNYNYNYAIDKNDGAGWSAMTTANYTATTLGTALNGIAGIDASKGFKLRLMITTITANTTPITSVYMTTTSTTTTQAYQYPLDIFTLTLTNVVVGSAISVEAYSTGEQLFFGIATSTTQVINLVVYQSGDPKNDLRIKVRQGTTAPYYKPYETRQQVTVGSASLYIEQQLD
jgi:hypothetical protein